MKKSDRKDANDIKSFGLDKLNELKDNAADITKSTLGFVDDTVHSIFSKEDDVYQPKRGYDESLEYSD